ncbi:MFS transporter [Paenibacillaceae sp. P-4]|uniref:MFS transporter n=1 Tax=Paenibacillaceae bacterium P-4 TaxID=3160969 RepID=UPI0032E82ED4
MKSELRAIDYSLPNKRSTRYTILLILSLFLVSTNLRAAITSISPLLEDIQRDLGMNGISVSLLTSIPLFCMGIFAPMAASLSDRLGMERAITVCIGLIGIATAARFFAVTSFLLLLTALLAGIGIAVAGPLISGFIKHHFPAHASSIVGVYLTGMGIGASISSAFAIPIERAAHGSWSTALGIWSIFAVIGILAWWPIIRKHALTDHHDASSRKQSSKLPWNNKQAWLFLIIFGLQSGIYYTAATWLAPRAQEIGMDAATAGTLVTVYSIMQMIAGLVTPLMLNRTTSRKSWLLAFSICSLAGCSALSYFPAEVNPFLSAAVMGIGAGGLFSIALILPLDVTSTSRDASLWTAMIQFGGYLIGGLLPLVSGVFYDIGGSYQASFLILIFTSLILIAVSVFYRGKRYTHYPQQ